MHDFESVKAPSIATPTDNYREIVDRGGARVERCYIVNGGGAEPRLEWRPVTQLDGEAIDGEAIDG